MSTAVHWDICLYFVHSRTEKLKNLHCNLIITWMYVLDLIHLVSSRQQPFQLDSGELKTYKLVRLVEHSLCLFNPDLQLKQKTLTEASMSH